MNKTALTIKIDPILNQRFRIGVIKKYGVKRGSISKTIEEAIVFWLKENEEQEVSNPSSKEESGNQGDELQG